MDGLGQHSVIVVDDDPEVGAAIKEIAEGRRLPVAVALDSRRFRELYRSAPPSLVFLDLSLPGDEDGVELLRFLAQQNCKAQIVLISGAGRKVLGTVARLARVHGLDLLSSLKKPLAAADLEEVFTQALKGRWTITESALRAALPAGELVLHYQPKINLRAPAARAIDAVEALIRWQHPKYGLIGPDEFVPLSETCGLSKVLTDFVVAEAAAQAKRWRDQGLDLTVAVNLPAPLLGDLALADRIDDCLRAVGLPTSRMILEVTESGVMADVAKAMETLTRLRLKGLTLSMDDFGTGYSSLVQLYRLPFSELKIDRTFVGDLSRGDEARIIVQSIIDLAHKLEMVVCGEGVEDPEAARLLRSWGCDRAQGFRFAPALPAVKLEALLRDQERLPAAADEAEPPPAEAPALARVEVTTPPAEPQPAEPQKVAATPPPARPAAVSKVRVETPPPRAPRVAVHEAAAEVPAVDPAKTLRRWLPPRLPNRP